MKDTPFAPLQLFQPYEAPVVAKLNVSGVWSEYLTAKEGISTLPGMWTHRLFNGQRVFINHRGVNLRRFFKITS